MVDAGKSLLIQENSLIGLQCERLQALNQQAVLLGTALDSPVAEPMTLPKPAMPSVNANIPASVLRQRPDISAKEWRVREALANVDIKRTEFYPAFRLTGSLGTSSRSLMAFLQNPVGYVGANLTLPFLEWRQQDVAVKIARNDYEKRLLGLSSSFIKR